MDHLLSIFNLEDVTLNFQINYFLLSVLSSYHILVVNPPVGGLKSVKNPSF